MKMIGYEAVAPYRKHRSKIMMPFYQKELIISVLVKKFVLLAVCPVKNMIKITGYKGIFCHQLYSMRDNIASKYLKAGVPATFHHPLFFVETIQRWYPLYYPFSGYPISLRESVISSRQVGSSMVDGILYSLPPAMERMVPRRILPDLVLGKRATTAVSL